MYHDPELALQAKADPRPKSAVSSAVGWVGMAGMTAWLVVAHWFGLDGPYAGLVNVAAAGVPMVLWSIFVDKVYRNPTTGIDWNDVKPWRATLDVSLTKLAGLWLTWGGIGAIFALGRVWWATNFANYPFSMWAFQTVAPWLFVASVPYVLWLDRRLKDPKDGAWALGAWLMGTGDADTAKMIPNHLRSWAVKGFFLAFMIAIVPPNFGDFVRTDPWQAMTNPVWFANYCISFMFVIDVAFATAGYVLTFRPLDSHIRTANPYAAGWMAALICYPPFLLMGDGGPLDYHPGTADWTYWFANHPYVLATLGAVLVGLTGFYAWATVAFGMRFSNLTHRGVLTHGPYAITRHPAYLAKNTFWWLSTIPMLATTGDWTDSLRNTFIMALVTGVYYWRAKTEERHLREDPVYQEYDAWMARNGAVPRFFAMLKRKITA
jgi:protein-S-isoprenylcysteine O-methyltransferase Ste14